MLAAARMQTDFGDDGFREPLRVLLRALDEQARLSAVGRFMQAHLLGQLLRNRLLIQYLLPRHAEIATCRSCARS